MPRTGRKRSESGIYHIVLRGSNRQTIFEDEEAISIIKTTCNLNQCSDFRKLAIDKRDIYLKALKEKGLSTRQLARLTVISRSIILKV